MTTSRKVLGYVKVARRLDRLGARLADLDSRYQERTAGLRARVRDLLVERNDRYRALTGGQLAEARRLLAEPASITTNGGGA